MRIQWTYLLVAIALLLPPLRFSAALERVLLKARGGGLPQVLGAVRVWQNWVDLLRAVAGGYLLSQWAIVENSSSPTGGVKALGLECVILGVLLLVQTVRRMRSVQILAPIFYLCGLTLILGGLLQGGFAVVVGWLFAIGGKNLAYQLPAMSFALAAAGYVLGLGPSLVVNCALIFVPMVLAALFKKRLLFASSPMSL